MSRPARIMDVLSSISKAQFFTKRLKVQQTNDGMAAFFRGEDGNAYEVVVRPAKEARHFKEAAQIEEGVKDIKEASPPGMEDWIKKNKKRFKDEYGDDWEDVLYGTAWNLHRKKDAE